MRNLALIAFTREGCTLAAELARDLSAGCEHAGAACSVAGPARFAADAGIDAYESLAAWTAEHFERDDALVFVGATGIAVRAIAPHVRDKFSDPAVVSVDEAGRFAVPLLSGHVGGANELARAIADITGGQAVVSTATDVNGLFAVDEWAARHNLAIVERAVAKEVSADLLEGRPIGCASDFGLPADLPAGIVDVSRDDLATCPEIGFTVSLDDTAAPFARTLHLVPRAATIGVGCRRGAATAVLEAAVREALDSAHISAQAVTTLASIDVKRDEVAIGELAEKMGWVTKFYTADELVAVPGAFSHSDFVERTVGVGNVCERAACAGGGALVVKKQSKDGVTVAVAIDEAALDSSDWRMHG